MSWLTDTLALYVRVFRKGAVLTAANWPLALLVVCYPMGLLFLNVWLAPLGFVGGILWTLALSACVSSWLHFMEQVVQGTGRAHLPDLPRSFATYLGDVVNVLFLIFVLRLLLNLVVAPASELVAIVLSLAMAVFFNAVLELIYLGRYSGPDLLMASYRFIGTNWIEWFPATILLLALAFGLDRILPAGPFGFFTIAAVGLVVAYASIVRGLLYLELATSSRRAREFKRRASM
ncbi:MAG: hypothetical protein KIT14_16775 [bacterium]|nr:hypothetical protein [bacterium]